MKVHNPKTKTRFLTGFFWLAMIILFAGGTLAVLLSLDKTYTAAHLAIRLTLLLTGAAVVLCVIIATSDWWLKR